MCSPPRAPRVAFRTGPAHYTHSARLGGPPLSSSAPRSSLRAVLVRRLPAAALILPLLAAAASAAPSQELWIANAKGDDVVVYEVGTWKLLARLELGANPNGLAATADGRTVFVSLERFDEPTGELVWIRTSDFQVIHRLEVGWRAAPMLSPHRKRSQRGPCAPRLTLPPG